VTVAIGGMAGRAIDFGGAGERSGGIGRSVLSVVAVVAVVVVRSCSSLGQPNSGVTTDAGTDNCSGACGDHQRDESALRCGELGNAEEHS
jgi:hypothetical protein